MEGEWNAFGMRSRNSSFCGCWVWSLLVVFPHHLGDVLFVVCFSSVVSFLRFSIKFCLLSLKKKKKRSKKGPFIS